MTATLIAVRVEMNWKRDGVGAHIAATQTLPAIMGKKIYIPNEA